MPLYEFRCQECQHRFTALVPYAEREKVVCPRCASKQVRLLLASFSLGGRPSDGCGTNVPGGG